LVADFKKDFDEVAELITRDYSGRFNNAAQMDRRNHPQRGPVARFGHQAAHAG